MMVPSRTKKHTNNRNIPYAAQPSPPPPPPPQNPKPKHGNTREMHAKKVSWDKCKKKLCKVHREEKGRNQTVGTLLEKEEGKKPQNWRSGEETVADEDGLHRQLAEPRRKRDTLKATIHLQDDTIMTEMDTIEQQWVAIDSGTIALNMMKRLWHGEENINRNLGKELRRVGRL